MPRSHADEAFALAIAGTDHPMILRKATPTDADVVWEMLESIVRAGEAYALPRDLSRKDGLAYWFSPEHTVFAAEEDGAVLGSYYLRANQRGGGAHVCNCGYMTAPHAGGRGVARAMCLHSLDVAREQGFRAMQFNFVISTNERAVRLWVSLGFATIGRLPAAFHHPTLGYVDALVMYRTL